MQNSGGARPKIMGHSSPNIGMFIQKFFLIYKYNNRPDLSWQIARPLATAALWVRITGCRPPFTIPLRVGKAGRNHLNEDIDPLLPIRIGERYSQTISTFLRHAALQRRCELPHINEKLIYYRTLRFESRYLSKNKMGDIRKGVGYTLQPAKNLKGISKKYIFLLYFFPRCCPSTTEEKESLGNLEDLRNCTWSIRIRVHALWQVYPLASWPDQTNM